MLPSNRDRTNSKSKECYGKLSFTSYISLCQNKTKIILKRCLTNKWIWTLTIILTVILLLQYHKLDNVEHVIVEKVVHANFKTSPKFVSKPLQISSSELLKTNKFDNIELIKSINDIISKQTVVITGMVKDGEPDLLGTLVQIEKLACHWHDFDILILTNNNQDNTSLLLDVWSKRPLHCDQIQIDLANRNQPFYTKKYIIGYNDTSLPKKLSREDRYTYYRNHILDYVTQTLLIEKSKQLNNDKFMYDSWMMIDFDIQGIENFRIFQEFSIASVMLNVDVFCVNGMEWTGRYRDSFATVFYDGQWCYDDGVQCSKIIQQNRYTQVRSCFGGLSIYSFPAIKQSECRYHTRAELKDNAKITHDWFKKQNPKWEDLCEHIAFNDCLYTKFNENLTLIISRESHLYYGFQQYEKWQVEPLLYGVSN